MTSRTCLVRLNIQSIRYVVVCLCDVLIKKCILMPLSLSLPLISVSSLLSFFRGRCILGVESRVLHEVSKHSSVDIYMNLF